MGDNSLSLHRMRGEGRGEGFRASAQAPTPLIRPAATFSPPPRKGEGLPPRLGLAISAPLSSCALSLTLTLSRWERGQPGPPVVVPSAPAPAQRWMPFSLSQRERAGVRENGQCVLLPFALTTTAH
jgi:hypothetical protein